MTSANGSQRNKILALSGGVGGAKLALGLAHMLPTQQLTIVANTADDFSHLGLTICPDLDTVMYTLAGINNKQQGWGLADESWAVMSALTRIGAEDWFQLGDQDIATHLQRSQQLANSDSLSAVTEALCQRLGVKHKLLPMSDDPVRTQIKTAQGDLAFQHYFVRERCRPAVSGFYFSGIEQAKPQHEFMALLQSDELAAIIICPSNPFVSVEPILQLAGVREAMAASAAPVIAVSPIVAGLAIKGPAAKMMTELEIPATATAVAEYYGDLLDGFVLDQTDQHLQSEISALGLPVLSTATIMKTLQDRIDLASAVLSFAENIIKSSLGGRH
ncbi:MAG: LPPG:FO 2-phospho-L-lactate transferase [Oceanicoccus sp.]|jgi:LPPG:FO 2-phospho-L-lactate transferase